MLKKISTILLLIICAIIALIYITPHYSLVILENVINIAKASWNYKIATIDNKDITIANLAFAIILLIAGASFSKHLSRLLHQKMLKIFQINNNVGNIVEKLIYYTLIVIIGCTALEIANIPLSGLTFIGGALAIGLGFGSQNILNNFISGIIIMIESPITVGNIIEIDGKIARVINIGARCVHLKTYDNIDLMVPNSTIIQSIITNWTLDDNLVRVTTSFLIDGECNPTKAKALLEQAIDQNPHIVHHLGKVVALNSFDTYGMKFEILFFINILKTDRRMAINDLNLAAHHLLSEHGLKIAYCKNVSIAGS